MSEIHDHRRSAVDRVLSLRARGDLQSVEVAFGGQASYVVKDPVAGETYHLTVEEHRLFTALRQPVSLRALQRIIESEFAPREASVAQLQQFVNRLYEQGLLVGDGLGQGAQLLERGQQRRRQARRGNLVQLLSIRLGSFDAGGAIDRLYGIVRWIWSPWSLAVALGVFGYAMVIVLGNAPAIAARLPAVGELVQPSRLPLWIAAIATVKVLHELGHALTCRHFGARPGEMGVLLLAGAPALYCDVTDAWRLPSKWRRMAVSSAGMAVELLVASIAAIAWWFAASGVFSAICLSLIVVCSVGTLAINANPLLRYDGYYMLADALEVPNLAERSRGLVSTAWQQWILGERAPSDPLLGPGKRRTLWVYAILSKIYLVVVLVGMLVLFVHLAKPHGLQNVVHTAAAVILAGLLAAPLTAAAKMWSNPSVRQRLRWLRLGGTFAVLGSAALAVWFWPMTRRIEAPLVTVPAKAHPLFAEQAGKLEFAVGEGVTVQTGDVIAQLANPELQLALAAAEDLVRERSVRVAQLRILQGTTPAAARMLPTSLAELADAEAQLVEQRAMSEQLVIRAPAAGRVLAPPRRVADVDAEVALRPWAGSSLAGQNRGAWIEQGTPVAVVAESGGWIAWAGVDQADVAAVEEGQLARMIVDERPTTILEGRVVQVSRRARESKSDDSQREKSDEAALGDDRYHVVELAVEASDDALFAGARGVAKITTYDTTLGDLAWTTLRRAFSRVF